jgi:hypothetical protein
MVPSILAEIALATEADRQKKHMTAKAVTTLDALPHHSSCDLASRIMIRANR